LPILVAWKHYNPGLSTLYTFGKILGKAALIFHDKSHVKCGHI